MAFTIDEAFLPAILYPGEPPRRRAVAMKKDNLMTNTSMLKVLVAFIGVAAPVVRAQSRVSPSGPTVEFSPNPVNFGYLAPGYNESVALTVTNTGGSDLVITKDELSRLNPFFVSQDECAGKVVKPRESCQVELSFDPMNYWAHDAAAYYTLFHNASARHQNVLLYGWDEPK
jgi:hypothetical protein